MKMQSLIQPSVAKALGLLLLILDSSLISAAEKTIPPQDILAKNKSAVVRVSLEDEDGRSINNGSGFIINKRGYILTNWHAVKQMILGETREIKAGQSVGPFFTKQDIIDKQGLLERLKDHRDLMTKYIYESIAEELKTQITDAKPQGPDSEELLAQIIIELNRRITDPDLSNEKHISAVMLGRRAKRIIENLKKEKKPLNGEALFRLNRWILEDAFPSELRRREKITLSVTLLNKDGHEIGPIYAEIIKADNEIDVALLKVPGEDLPSVDVGDSNALEEGHNVCVLSFPFGRQHNIDCKGNIAGLDRHNGYFEMNAAIYPGSSGGPVIETQHGKVVGIAVGGVDGYAEVNFGIPINHSNLIVAMAGLSAGRTLIQTLQEEVKSAKEETAVVKRRVAEVEELNSKVKEMQEELVNIKQETGNFLQSRDQDISKLQLLATEVFSIKSQIIDLNHKYDEMTKVEALHVDREVFPLHVFKALHQHLKLGEIQDKLKENHLLGIREFPKPSEYLAK